MNTKQFGSRSALLAVTAAGLWASPVRADIIAEDAFNYIPTGASLGGAAGGTGWYSANIATDPATVTAGLPYAPYSIGLGNGARVGNDLSDGGLSRGIATHTAPATYWIRALYSVGTTGPTPNDTVTPFLFQGINSTVGGYFSLDRLEGASVNNMMLNMTPADGSLATDPDPSYNFTLSPGTHMLLWKLSVNQTLNARDQLEMWVDPTALLGNNLPEPNADMMGDILGNDGSYDDFLGNFYSTGAGDIIDELVIGSSFADAISQLSDPVTSVPEVSGPVMMAMVGFLGGGVVWYRRRQKAVA